jgi:hypothetical protein
MNVQQAGKNNLTFFSLKKKRKEIKGFPCMDESIRKATSDEHYQRKLQHTSAFRKFREGGFC